MNFRKVKDEDFKQISVLYGEYIDWQKANEPYDSNPKLTAEQMIKVYHKELKGSQAANYDLRKKKSFSDHYGYVAEENGVIYAYFEWGGKVNKGSCGCYISVWKDGYQNIAEELLVWTFGELKKEGFKTALGHMPERMLKDQRFQWIEKYSQRKVPETEDGKDLQFQRDL